VSAAFHVLGTTAGGYAGRGEAAGKGG